MKKLAALLFAFGSFPLVAQDQSTGAASPPPVQTNSNPNPLTSLAGEILGTNYFNYFGFASGVYDSTRQVLGLSNQGSNGSVGIDVGGGLQLSHEFGRSSLLSLNYRGDYRNYTGNGAGSGTNQALSFIFTRQLSRRWTLSLLETGGITFYGSSYYANLANSGLGYQTNPFSPSTRFSSSSAFLSYHASRRLSYTLGGSFFLNRYNFPGAIGSTGGLVTGSVSYQFTNRTFGSLTYSHDDFYFQRSAGESHINGLYASGNHHFGQNISVFGSFGYTEANSLGTINVPVTVLFNGQEVSGYVVGHYNTTHYIPTLNGGISKSMRQYAFSASAGRGVSPGNGTVLTSTSTYFGGFASRNFHEDNSTVGVAAFYSHISSIANQVATTYTQSSFTVHYSRVLLRHVSGSASYGYFRYGTFLNYGSVSNNRLTFGVTFSSKTVPVTIF